MELTCDCLENIPFTNLNGCATSRFKASFATIDYDAHERSMSAQMSLI